MIINKQEIDRDTSIYMSGEIENDIYVVSHPYSRAVLCNPEITGFQLYSKLKAPTKSTIEFVLRKYNISRINILNIKRGGLNFPIEESCYNLDNEVDAISFISTERIIADNNACPKVEVKSDKIVLLNDATLFIGDIIASGETIRKTIEFLIKNYKDNNIKLDRIVILTIGTLNALSAIRRLNEEILKEWSDFKGFVLVLYEGIFSYYNSFGVTGLNAPQIDFSLNSIFIAPEYRSEILDYRYLLFEKCPIYDGGARRFEPHDHKDLMLDYWGKLYAQSSTLDYVALMNEKLGYNDMSLEDWNRKNKYIGLEQQGLYKKEMEYLKNLSRDLVIDICKQRYENLCDLFL